jgi:hypothetical protein
LGQKIGAKASKEGVDPVAEFRLAMLKNMDSLFAHETKLAYDAMQTPDLLDPHGAKPLALMNARLSDLLPPEHVRFATYEPETMHRLVSRIAYHGAFGRNAESMKAAFGNDGLLMGKKSQADTLLNHSTEAGQIARCRGGTTTNSRTPPPACAKWRHSGANRHDTLTRTAGRWATSTNGTQSWGL